MRMFLWRLNPIDRPRFAENLPYAPRSFVSTRHRHDGFDPSGKGRSAIALVFMAGVALGNGLAQERPISLQLKPRQPQTLIVSLEKSQMALVHLHLHGGIVGVRETAPDGKSRPLWLIDLGREATLTYVADGSQPGDQALEITSFEKARLAEISVELIDPLQRMRP